MSPKKRNQRLLGYVRVSRAKEGGISPDLQKSAIEAYAIAHGHEVVWLEPDLDESGKSLDRPSMKDALTLLEQGEADGIIAARLDRLTRKVSDLGTLLDLATEQDWNLVAIDLGVDLTTANGQVVANVLASIAQWERQVNIEKWNNTHRDAVLERGIHLSGKAPAGYDYTITGVRPNGKPKRGPLVPNEHAPAILAAFEQRADGASLPALGRLLTDAGVPGTWNTGAVLKVLKNRVYLGEARGGQGLVHEGAHEAIIDAGLWARVQARWQEKGSYVNPASRPKQLLAGLVVCAGCGKRMTPDTDKTGYLFWRCRGGVNCSAKPTISDKVLRSYVLQQVEESGRVLSIGARSNDEAVRLASVRLDNATAALDAFESTWVDQGLAPADAIAMRTPLVAARDEAAVALNEATANGGSGDREALNALLQRGYVVPDEDGRVVASFTGERLSELIYALALDGEALEREAAENGFDLDEDETRVYQALARKFLGSLVARVTVAKGGRGAAGRTEVTFAD